jgi:hypothetical protein
MSGETSKQEDEITSHYEEGFDEQLRAKKDNFLLMIKNRSPDSTDLFEKVEKLESIEFLLFLEEIILGEDPWNIRDLALRFFLKLDISDFSSNAIKLLEMLNSKPIIDDKLNFEIGYFLKELEKRNILEPIHYFFKNLYREENRNVLDSYLKSFDIWNYDETKIELLLEIADYFKLDERAKFGEILAKIAFITNKKNYEVIKQKIIDIIYDVNNLENLESLLRAVSDLRDADYVPAMSDALLRNKIDPSKDPQLSSPMGRILIEYYSKAYRSRYNYKKAPSCEYCRKNDSCPDSKFK